VATFTPPIDNRVPPILPDTQGLAFLLFRHYASEPRGRNVFIINGTPGTGAGGTVTESDPLGTDYINRVFYGGHGPYTDVTAIEAALLTAAGYVVT
jgi:hypothetical protein